MVYQKLGVEVLRRAWINLDLLWVGALVVAGGVTLGLGLLLLLPNRAPRSIADGLSGA